LKLTAFNPSRVTGRKAGGTEPFGVPFESYLVLYNARLFRV
jgi:hypothetical protein